MGDFKWTYYFPFKNTIPNYIDNYLEKNSFFKRYLKFIKRRFYIFLKGQNNLEVLAILPEHQNILWINISASSLGDSLMDLSSRVMLKDKNIDLFTDHKNSNIYEDDLFFDRIFTRTKDVVKCTYDLVILDSYSTRSVKVKSKLEPLTPFLGMYGYFNGPEVNRVLFSFQQMNNLLGYSYSQNQINKIARTSMTISASDQKIVELLNLPNFFIAIVIGGEWKHRTFNKWALVVKELLLKDNNLKIILLGSDNGKLAEKKILDQFSTPNLISYISRLTFNQTAEVISRANLLFCCDGGLMHAANSFSIKTISLFARLDAEMQLTSSCRSFPIFDQVDMNNISVENIMLKYDEAINYDYNHPGS